MTFSYSWYGVCSINKKKHIDADVMYKVGTVLVVDDDDALTWIVAEILRAKGFEVWTARNGEEGYASYFRHRAEVVVTDIQMPESDGFEMMRCIRGINQNVKTIYVSGAVERYHSILEQEAGEFGAVVLSKPFSSGDLLKLIYNWTKNAGVRVSTSF